METQERRQQTSLARNDEGNHKRFLSRLGETTKGHGRDESERRTPEVCREREPSKRVLSKQKSLEEIMEKQKIKTLIIEMPAELHAAFVLKAKSDDLSMAQVVRQQIREYVKPQEGKQS